MPTHSQPWLRAELIAAPETTPGAQLMIPADGVEFHDDELVFHHQGDIVYVAQQGQLRSITWSARQPNPETARRKAQWPNHGTRWTDEEREDLLRRIRAGQSWKAISHAHGRSRTGCQQEAVKQGWLEPETLLPKPEVLLAAASQTDSEGTSTPGARGETDAGSATETASAAPANTDSGATADADSGATTGADSPATANADSGVTADAGSGATANAETDTRGAALAVSGAVNRPSVSPSDPADNAYTATSPTTAADPVGATVPATATSAGYPVPQTFSEPADRRTSAETPAKHGAPAISDAHRADSTSAPTSIPGTPTAASQGHLSTSDADSAVLHPSPTVSQHVPPIPQPGPTIAHSEPPASRAESVTPQPPSVHQPTTHLAPPSPPSPPSTVIPKTAASPPATLASEAAALPPDRPRFPPRVPRQRTSPESQPGSGPDADSETDAGPGDTGPRPGSRFLSRAQSSLARATLGAYMNPPRAQSDAASGAT